MGTAKRTQSGAGWLMDLSTSSWPAEKSASYSGEVDAGERTGIRLRNLADGVSLHLEVVTSGHITVSLLREKRLRKGRKARQVLRSMGDGHLAFTVVIRESGDYVLVMDNCEGKTRRDYTVNVRASLGSPSGTRAKLHLLETLMRRAFVFDAMKIEAGHCAGEDKGPNTVLICSESVTALHQAVGDKELVDRTLSFNLIREIGRILLRQWQHPAQDNERFVDELATVLFVLLGQGQSIRDLAATVRQRGPTTPNPRTDAGVLGESLTVSRACRISDWLDDPDLLREWQPTLVPHMQTSLLESLQKQPRDWTVLQLVTEELDKRRAGC